MKVSLFLFLLYHSDLSDHFNSLKFDACIHPGIDKAVKENTSRVPLINFIML